MNGKQVEMLETELEKAVGRVVQKMAKDGHIKMPPSKRIYHLMAKAATAVFEAAEK